MTNPKPNCIESIAHAIQLWALTKSDCCGILCFVTRPIIWLFTLYQSVRANKGKYLMRKRFVFGENFCCAGGVWIGGFEEVKKNLLEPQARTLKLAPSNLDPQHLPDMNLNGGGRLTFLLALSSKGAGGNGDHEAFRAAFVDYITETEETRLRQKDEVAQGLLQQLVAEYQELGHTTEFFDNNDRALQDFLLKYLHYVLFGIDPNDKHSIQALNSLHYDSSSAAYYLKSFGNLLQCLKFRDWPQKMKECVKIYAESPALRSFEDGQAKYNNMTRYELANLALSIMSLAGMVGPLTMANIILGHTSPVNFQTNTDIDVVSKWDTLNLDDSEDVKRYIYECCRLRNPVSNSHKVAQEDFTVTIRGRERTFPKGTVIFIPMLMGGLDESVWGKTAYEFDHNRKNLCPFSMFFHSVGDQTNGRICPGKKIAEEMLISVMIALGKERRSKMT